MTARSKTIGQLSKLAQPSEHDEQAAVVSWARLQSGAYPELAFLFAIPNGAALPHKTVGGQRVSLQALKLKAEGMLPGVSDLFLPAARGGYHGLFLEMKAGDNKPTLAQDNFLQAMMKAGYLVDVCWSAGDAIAVITAYLKL